MTHLLLNKMVPDKKFVVAINIVHIMNIIHYITYMRSHGPMSIENDMFTDTRDPGATGPAASRRETGYARQV
jgi:hypothetical protein